MKLMPDRVLAVSAPFDKAEAMQGIIRSLLLIVYAMAASTESHAADDRTQIVVQLRIDGHASAGMAWRAWQWGQRIARRCGPLCFVDGHDIGGSTVSVILYAVDDRVDAVVALVVGLIQEGKLPATARIGVAEYLNAERTDWRFRPAYPAGLEAIDLTYSEGPSGLPTRRNR